MRNMPGAMMEPINSVNDWVKRKLSIYRKGFADNWKDRQRRRRFIAFLLLGFLTMMSFWRSFEIDRINGEIEKAVLVEEYDSSTGENELIPSTSADAARPQNRRKGVGHGRENAEYAAEVKHAQRESDQEDNH